MSRTFIFLIIKSFLGNIRIQTIKTLLLSLVLIILISTQSINIILGTNLQKIALMSESVIEVVPVKGRIYSVSLDTIAIPLYKDNETIGDLIKSPFLSREDIKYIEQIPGVEKVITGNIISLEIFWGYNKCFDSYSKDSILEFYISQLTSNYNIPREEVLKNLEALSKELDRPIENISFELAKGFFTRVHNILSIDTDIANDVITVFNNIVEGQGIINKTQDILISLDMRNISYVNYSINKVAICDERVEINDWGEILDSRSNISGKTVRVKLGGILLPNYLFDGVIDRELLKHIITNRFPFSNEYVKIVYNELENKKQVAYVIVNDTALIPEVIESIKQILPSSGVTPLSQSAIISSASVKSMEAYLNTLYTSSILIFLLSFFSIEAIDFTRRKKEFGLLKIYGWKGWRIKSYYILPSVIISLLSLVIAFTVYGYLQNFLFDYLFSGIKGELPNYLYIRIRLMIKDDLTTINTLRTTFDILPILIISAIAIPLIITGFFNRKTLQEVLHHE